MKKLFANKAALMAAIVASAAAGLALAAAPAAPVAPAAPAASTAPAAAAAPAGRGAGRGGDRGGGGVALPAKRAIELGPDPTREIPLPEIPSKMGKMPDWSAYPVQKNLPDPMIMNDGTKVTTPEQWKVRREEIRKILAYYDVGQSPPSPGNVKGKEVRSELVADGKVKYRLIHLTFGPDEKLFLDIGIFTPATGGPFPAIISQSGSPPGATALPQLPKGLLDGHSTDVLLKEIPPFTVTTAPAAAAAPGGAPDGMAGAPAAAAGRGGGGFGRGPATAESLAQRNADVLSRGYAIVMYNNGDCAEDTTLRELDGSFSFRHTRFYPAYPGYDWGILAGWAWGASRVEDYLETDPRINSKVVLITGASRAGKSSMVAAAFDDRLIGAPVVTGGGGIGVFRASGVGRGGGEGLGEMANKYPNWFGPQLRTFWTHTDQLPYDNHWFLALCAPRPFIALEGNTDTVSLALAVKASIKAAWPVYEFLGAKDHLGMHYSNHAHAFTAEDWTAMMDFTDKVVFHKNIDNGFNTFLAATPDWTPTMFDK